MKIVKQDQNLMILSRSRLVGLFVGGIFVMIGFFQIFQVVYLIQKTPLWQALIFVVLGIFVIATSHSVQINIDKNQGKMIVINKSLVKTEIQEVELSKITALEFYKFINYTTNSKGNNTQHTNKKLAFLASNGEELYTFSPDTITVSGPFIRSKGKDEEFGNKIAQFLNIPFRIARPPTAQEILDKVAEAVGRANEQQKKDL